MAEEPGIFASPVTWFKYMKATFGELVESLVGLFITHTPKITQQVENQVKGFLAGIEDTMWDNLVNYYQSLGLLTPQQAENIVKIKDTIKPFDTIAFLTLSVKLFYTYLNAQTESSANLMQQAINKEIPSTLPSPGDMLRAAFVAPEKTGEVRDALQRLGLPADIIDLMFLANYQLYPMEVVRELFLRGVLSQDEMFMRMRELGFTDTRIHEIIQSWDLLPGPTDLFWMVGKEAFEPEIYNKIGLNDEFPEEQVSWLKKQGISRDWAEKYWIAHWDQPSIGQGYEMYQRQDPENPGHTIIDDSELDILFKAVEIPPFWRDKLKKIAYQPYTRVDSRRMHDLGILSNEDLYWVYRDQGYDHEKATNMMHFTIQYNLENDKNLTKTQILQSYIKSLITREDCVALLEQIGYSTDRVEYMITYEEFNRDMEDQDKLINNIGDKFKENIIDDLEARDLLGKLNITGTRTELLMDEWSLFRYKDQKLPSKTDFDKFYTAGIIDGDQYSQNLQRLGYTVKHIQYYKQILDNAMEG